MTWTWEDEKKLGLAHMENMAALNRKFENIWRESAAGDVDRADKYAAEAARFEQAANEIRAEQAERELPPIRHRIMCGIATANGLPCSRVVALEGDRCWQHPEAP